MTFSSSTVPNLEKRRALPALTAALFLLLFLFRQVVRAAIPAAAAPSLLHSGLVLLNTTTTTTTNLLIPPKGPEFFWYHIAVSSLLVLAGGVFAGLTLGLMGLDELHLRVLATSSEDKTEKRNAQKVLKLLQKSRHWVLVVLLLGNVIINESLPVFLNHALGGGMAAVVTSTTAIVIFGIIPQAISVRYGLFVGATCAPLVQAMMYIFAPIAYPIAKILDLVLGTSSDHYHHTYKKAELKSFLQFHHQTGEEPLRDDELAILNAVLELNTKTVELIMTPLRDVTIFSADTILDHKVLAAILQSGYSRFPIHDPGDPTSFVGLLLVKTLLTYDPSKPLPISAFPLSILPEAHPSVSCFQALDYFQTGRAHLLMVSRTPGKAGGALGVVTLEDVIEEIISEEIIDETDRYHDNKTKSLVARKSTTSLRGIVERHNRSPPFQGFDLALANGHCDVSFDILGGGDEAEDEDDQTTGLLRCGGGVDYGSTIQR